jgi:hypothetical protein
MVGTSAATSGEGEWRALAGIVLPRAFAIVVSLAAYLVVHRLTLRALGLTSGELRRSEMLPASAIRGRLHEVKNTLWDIFVSSEPLVPVAIKLLIGMLCILAVGVLVRRAWQTIGASRYIKLTLMGGCAGVATLSVIGVTMPLAMWWPVDRVLAAVSVLVGGALALAVVNGGRWTRAIALGIACVLIFSFTGVNNMVLAEQLRLNSRDVHTAGRMVARLEVEPGFAGVRSIAVVGHMRQYPLRFFTTEYGSDVNVSAFEKPWSKSNVLREVSGYQFLEPSPEDMARAENYCSGVRPWPDAKSVTVLGDTAVVCLPEAVKPARTR